MTDDTCTGTGTDAGVTEEAAAMLPELIEETRGSQHE